MKIRINMDYEKEYNEALRRAEELHEAGDALTKKQMEVIFPQLAESEDERIRKVLCDIVRDMPYMETKLRAHGLTVEKTLAYLEKQKEQKPTEGTALQKAFIGSKIDYTLEEKCDASDYADAILPTSVAYGENEEEYKLHKIIEAAFIAGQKKEQQPAGWSERENKMLESAISHIRDSECFDHFHDITKEDIISWLKTLRPQPSWKPSEKQMKELLNAIIPGKGFDCDILTELYQQLKNL